MTILKLRTDLFLEGHRYRANGGRGTEVPDHLVHLIPARVLIGRAAATASRAATTQTQPKPASAPASLTGTVDPEPQTGNPGKTPAQEADEREQEKTTASSAANQTSPATQKDKAAPAVAGKK